MCKWVLWGVFVGGKREKGAANCATPCRLKQLSPIVAHWRDHGNFSPEPKLRIGTVDRKTGHRGSEFPNLARHFLLLRWLCRPEWVKTTTSNLNELIFLNVAVLICCCVKIRVPRTKQEIEADYQRKKITSKFTERLKHIQNQDMDALDLKRGCYN